MPCRVCNNITCHHNGIKMKNRDFECFEIKQSPQAEQDTASSLSELLTSEPIAELAFHFECGCNLRTRAVGDGCQICNTEYSFRLLPTQEELMGELVADGDFNSDQAYMIAADVYEPLVGLIHTMNIKIEQLAKALNKEVKNEQKTK